MAKYRNNLPLLDKDRIYLGEGGIMTDMFFGEETKDVKVPPSNLLFQFIKDEKMMNWANKYYRKFMDLCLKENTEFGFVIFAFFQYKARKQEVKKILDIDEDEWIKMNREYIQNWVDLRTEYETNIPNCPPIPIAGLVVPKGDEGEHYALCKKMTIEEAENYHEDQIKMMSQETKVDFLFAALVTYSEEAIGMCNVAAKYGLPVIISFTCKTDARLYGGETIKESIKMIDSATGKNKPFGYMINCAHITHFAHIFDEDDGKEYAQRIVALKPNGSKKSHEELNNSSTLDTGDHVEFGELLAKYKKACPNMNWISGCCGTDMRHLIETIKCLKKE